TNEIKSKLVAVETDKQKDESGKSSDSWTLVRFEVDILYSKICPTGCSTIVDECILNGSINDTAIGEFFSDFNIIVQDDNGLAVGSWDGEKWVVPAGSGGDCRPATYTVRDQFGNQYADGSIPSGDNEDIEITIEQTCSKLINAAETTGAGTPEANGTWI